jgi:hypothetical protein
MRLLAALGVAVAFLGSAGPARAWGDLGHKVTALIAYRHLTPKARTALEALLAADNDLWIGVEEGPHFGLSFAPTERRHDAVNGCGDKTQPLTLREADIEHAGL